MIFKKKSNHTEKTNNLRGEITMKKLTKRIGRENGGKTFSSGKHHYRLSIPQSNPYDLWFCRVNKKHGHYLTGNHSATVHVYLGSKNITADNLGFLDTIKEIKKC